MVFLIFQSSLAGYVSSQVCDHYNFMCLVIDMKLVTVRKYVLHPCRLVETLEWTYAVKTDLSGSPKTLIVVAGSDSALGYFTILAPSNQQN